jgi:hypothetical protein
MKISFDLDDLLICGMKKFETEPASLFHKLFSAENLRIGTVKLFKELEAQGHQVFIYTTSFRSPFRIWLTFKMHGLTLNGIYNKTIHDRIISGLNFSCSKFPPMFGIEVHIDDSEGVRMEGEKYNFRTIIISENDTVWTEKVLKELQAFR